ncbi:hypothetical protein AQUCO_00600098v1 [Aquilegia coerulea]|uniref:ATP-dependent DNA helicase n=1 Tax=Aquilegia coerulea TaxID=218851 RepID=A0A2G5EN51_AQUCA|nr:hypothetical protein AQUCO_00600098v1 [Aquilegia coerulea]
MEVNPHGLPHFPPAFVRRSIAQRARRTSELRARLSLRNRQAPISSHSSLSTSIASTSTPIPPVVQFPTEGVSLGDPYTYEDGDISVEELGAPNELTLHLPAEHHFLGRMNVFVGQFFPLTNAALFSTISRCMVHGPCGSRNLGASCMGNKNGTIICKVRFPRGFVTTTQMGKDGYSIYKRPDTGYIGPVEAAWHLFEFPMHKESPHVERLSLHLKRMHMVLFNPNDTPEQIEARALLQSSKLTAYFAYYTAFPCVAKFTYLDFPQHFVWKKQLHNNRWEPRQEGFAIGRMYFTKPNEGERFYLRLLLTIVKGCPSFEALKVVDHVLYPTYKDTCIALGLLEDGQEYSVCLQEASIIQTGYQLRRLFAILLTECSPIHPEYLWEQYALQICDDVSYKLQTGFGIAESTAVQIKDYGLFLLDKLLLESGKTFLDYPPMPSPVSNWAMEFGNRLLLEQMQLRFMFTSAEITTRHIVIMVASFGIASLLLFRGRTAHSTFKLPLDVVENNIVLRLSIEVFETLEVIQIRSVAFRWFLGGDFRHTLPVIPQGVREEVVDASIGRSSLWKYVEVLHLFENMRFEMEDNKNVHFANFHTKVGTIAEDSMEMPASIHQCSDLLSLILAIYPDLHVLGTATASFLRDRTILAPWNDDFKIINHASL